MGSIRVSTFVLIICWLYNQVGCLHGVWNPPASVPIPTQPPGMVLGNGSASAPVQIEVFLELLCPDSRDAWRILKTLSRVYEATKVRIVIHQFPLPYHSNGFVVTQVMFPLTMSYFIKIYFRESPERGLGDRVMVMVRLT